MFSTSLKWLTKRPSQALLHAAKKGDLSQIETLLQQDPSLDIFAIKDDEENTALHFAAAKGHVQIFYRLLKHSKEKNPQYFSDLINQCINKEGKTPWHYSALLGVSTLFHEPLGDDEKIIWSTLRKNWLNHADQDGNAPLHVAVFYDSKTTSYTIQNKKEIVDQLVAFDELEINKQNKEDKTPLHIAAAHGCFETSKPLFRSGRIDFQLVDCANEKVEDCAVKAGHQRMANAILFYQKKYKAKIKTTRTHPDIPTIIQAAKNPNYTDDDFVKLLHHEKDIEFMHEGKKINIVDLRITTLRKKYRSKNIKSALLGALCPAITAAAFLGGFGGFSSPAGGLSSLLTSIIFPVVYLPAAYVSYSVRSHEYGQLSAETLYKKWLIEKLNAYYAELAAISKKLHLISSNIKSASEQEREDLKSQYVELESAYNNLKQDATQFIQFLPNKVPKMHLRYLTADEFKDKKLLGIHDHKQNFKWVEKTESVKAIVSYAADVLCPVDGGLTVGAAVMSIVASKTGGFAFLGATGAAFLGGPLGIAILTVVATLGLSMLIGWALYKVSFQQERAEIGKLNRELLITHDKCKMRCGKIYDMDLDVESGLNNVQQAFNELPPAAPSRPIAITPAPKDDMSTPTKQADLPPSSLKNGLWDHSHQLNPSSSAQPELKVSKSL